MSAGLRAYVTYFDQRYLARALVMLRSLRRHDPGAEIHALCFDRTAFDVVAGLGDRNIIAVSADEIGAFEPELASCADRARWAFYSTHKPMLPLYVISRRPDIVAIIHVDADVCFFSTPAALFEEIGEASIALSPHRFSESYQGSIVYGRFNAGLIYWRTDAVGRQCLAEYRADCLRWCEDRVEADGRFMNQGYLSQWPERYPGVHVIRHPGVNLAYWNIAGHALEGSKSVSVDGQPLVFHHFSAVFQDPYGVWRTRHRDFGERPDLVLRAIYRPYLKEVERTERWLRRSVPGLVSMDMPHDIERLIPVRRGAVPPYLRGLYRSGRRASH